MDSMSFESADDVLHPSSLDDSSVAVVIGPARAVGPLSSRSALGERPRRKRPCGMDEIAQEQDEEEEFGEDIAVVQPGRPGVPTGDYRIAAEGQQGPHYERLHRDDRRGPRQQHPARATLPHGKEGQRDEGDQ